MPRGHAPFALFNRTGNPVIAAVLRSPLHPVLSGRLALITVTGRRSGRRYTFPVGYRADGSRVTIPVMWADRKVWWRNLRDGAPVELRLRGTSHAGEALAHVDERGGVTVGVLLDRDRE